MLSSTKGWVEFGVNLGMLRRPGRGSPGLKGLHVGPVEGEYSVMGFWTYIQSNSINGDMNGNTV